MGESKSGGSNNTAALQMQVCRLACLTFSLNAWLDGGSDWIRTRCVTKLGRPDFVAELSYFAVTGRYELCGLADYFGERGVEPS